MKLSIRVLLSPQKLHPRLPCAIVKNNALLATVLSWD